MSTDKGLVIVVAVLGPTAYESRVRYGTGEGSSPVPGIPVVSGASEQEVIRGAAAYIKPSAGPVTVDVRDPGMYE